MTQVPGCILILYDCQLISYDTLSECPLRGSRPCHNKSPDNFRKSVQAVTGGDAKVSLKPFREGEKKYSPPRGTMKSGIPLITLCSLLGSVPDMLRTPCPMRGSNLELNITCCPSSSILYNSPGFLRLCLSDRKFGVVRPL